MYSQTFFDAIKRSEPGVRYALKSGALASGWVLLNEDGTIHSHEDDTPECSGIWYYFEEDTDPDAKTDEKAGTITVMAADKEIEETVNNKTKKFRFGSDGHMLSQEWYEDEEGNRYYYQHNGEMVRSDKRLIDGEWVNFEADGTSGPLSADKIPNHRTVESVCVASDSNAEMKGAVGETLELDFYVSLASDSNARHQKFDRTHYDVWTEQIGLGRSEVGSATTDGVVTVKFVVKSTDECQVYLVVDGVRSDNCYIVTGVEEDKDHIDAIVPTNSNAEIDGETAVTIQSDLKSVYSGAEIDKDMKESFISQQDVLENVENAYIEEMGITKETEVTDGAKNLLGENGEISVIGLGLNAGVKQSVKLAIDEGEASHLEEDYDTVVAFEITMTINGEKQTELDVPVIITMTLPTGITGTDTTKLLHIHNDGDAEDITSQVTFENGKAIIVANKFSTYIFTEEKTGTDKPAVVSKEALKAAIEAAETAMEGIIVSDETADKVEKGTEFVTTAAMKALKDAIAAAEAVLNDEDATQAQADAAVTALKNAVNTFTDAIQEGTYVKPEDNDPTNDPDDGKTETPITDADKAAIEDAIANANAAMEGISVNNGTEANVASGTKFVSEEEMNALKAAIEAANEALANAKTTEEANAAIEALNKAIADFNAAIKTGTRTSSSSSGSGSGASSKGWNPKPAGQWIQDENGWWFRNSDGTYPAGTWQQLTYEISKDWYRFDANGYMCTGWFTDADGAVYYLNPISDGRMGAMLIGWQFIDGYWYYFNTVSDGHLGALLTNTTTPDGYQVNGLGQWIQ